MFVLFYAFLYIILCYVCYDFIPPNWPLRALFCFYFVQTSALFFYLIIFSFFFGSIFLGCCRTEYNLHRSFNSGAVSQYLARLTSCWWPRQPCRQWKTSSYRSHLHHMVHAWVCVKVCLKPWQVGIFQRVSQYYRFVSDITVLHFTVSFGIKQILRIVSRSQTNCANIQNHASFANFKTCPTQHRIAKFRIYHKKLIQRTWTSTLIPCHGCPDILQPSIFRRKRRERHPLQLHPCYLLVGCNYHDHRRVWRHGTNNNPR